jgi:hypothetical protein
VQTKHVKNDLMDYILGKLCLDEKSRVDLHLNQCPECRALLGELSRTAAVLGYHKVVPPDESYYLSILSRVREQLLSRHQVPRNPEGITARLIMPLAVSVITILLLMQIPSAQFTDYESMDALKHAMKEFKTEDVVQAVADAYSNSYLFHNQEALSAGIAEHLEGDKFLRDAVLKNLTSGEIADQDFEGIIVELDKEQVDQLLDGLDKREIL